jgi:hypothetical protein
MQKIQPGDGILHDGRRGTPGNAFEGAADVVVTRFLGVFNPENLVDIFG